MIGDILPDPAEMQRIAAEVGFCETDFAAPFGEGWRVRYFSPETEVPFCSHATIALGAALFVSRASRESCIRRDPYFVDRAAL